MIPIVIVVASLFVTIDSEQRRGMTHRENVAGIHGFSKCLPVVACDFVLFRLRPIERPTAVATLIRATPNRMTRAVSRVLLRTQLNIS